MSNPIPSIRSEFFGKDGFVPFIGFVEDVNDPKMSHRVKVRAIGWHPKSKPGNQSDDREDALSTDDIPWARVAFPTTMAQQNRIGGKHGLLVGCCVFGCFLDGQDAQDPLVLSSLNFTANSVEENNRKPLKGQDGKADPQDKAYEKKEVSGKTTRGNENLDLADGKEKNDVAKDTSSSSADSDCYGKAALESQRVSDNTNKENSKRNPGGKSTNTLQGDGMCGTIAHAQEDIQTKLQEMIPPQMRRFVFNDGVWDVVTGDWTDMNGIYAQLATIICNELKMPINSSKSFKNELNRKKRSVAIQAEPDRDGFLREKVEKAMSIVDDLFNGIFQKSFIDILCSLIMNMLTAINNNGDDENNDNRQGNRGPNTNTSLTNVEARCISETIVNNVSLMTEAAIEAAYANAESMAEEGGMDDTLEGILSILSGLSSVMIFPMLQKYAARPDVFNAAGPASQDILTKVLGCRQDRTYNTELGALGSIMGFSGGGSNGSGSSGGGSGSGSDNSRGLDRYENIGFGGVPVNISSNDITNDMCDEAYQIPYKDGDPIPDKVDTPFNSGENPRLDDPYLKLPGGNNGMVKPISLPSMDEICARNFINGTPNQIVVIKRGLRYFFNNDKDVYKTFPSVFIKGYQGTPVPVVDRESGELVAVLTNCKSFNPNIPNANVSIIPDDNETGITTDDPLFDITLGGFFIANTGFEYCNPKITIIDRDKGIDSNATAELVVVDGRIVDYNIINNGTAFKRIPDIKITDDGARCGTEGGYGAKLYPIMSVVERENKAAKKKLPPVNMSFCPSNQGNLY